MGDGQPARLSNRGGGYVEDVRVTTTRGGGHKLEFRGPIGTLNQVKLCDPRYLPYGTATGSDRRSLHGFFPAPTSATESLLILLETVLTVATAENVDFVLALDWYKTPVEDAPPTSWPNAKVGALVTRGKYWYKGKADAAKQRECGLALVDQLCQVIGQHPVLPGIDSVVAVPGHDPRVLSFGARLAAAVARHLKKPLIPCEDRTGFRTPIKNVQLGERASVINDKFICRDELTGQSLLIVDDIYSSGTTVSETARAARQAGADQVAGLCAVRTMRSV